MILRTTLPRGGASAPGAGTPEQAVHPTAARRSLNPHRSHQAVRAPTNSDPCARAVAAGPDRNRADRQRLAPETFDRVNLPGKGGDRLGPELPQQDDVLLDHLLPLFVLGTEAT